MAALTAQVIESARNRRSGAVVGLIGRVFLEPKRARVSLYLPNTL